VPPAYGELWLRAPAGAFSSPVGRDGRFYLEGVPAGTYTAEVEWSGGRCRAELFVPQSPAFADAGRVRCDPETPPKRVPVLVADSTPPPSPSTTPTTLTPASTSTPSPTSSPGPPDRSAAPRAPQADADDAKRKIPASTTATRSGAPASAAAARAGEPDAILGFGPPSRRCPSCAICFSAAFEQLASEPNGCVPRSSLVIESPLSRMHAAKACLVAADLEEQCSACIEIRRQRNCPTWADEPRGRLR
jgi:hypothetical protein